MYVDIEISNVFNLNKLFFSSSFLFLFQVSPKNISKENLCVIIYTKTLFFPKSSKSKQLWLLKSISVNNINIELLLNVMNIINVKYSEQY